MVADLFDDVRYSARALARSPAIAAILLVSLAVGTGANATVFSFLQALLFRPPPRVAAPERLISIYTSQFDSNPYGDSSFADYASLRADSRTFEQLTAFNNDLVIVLAVRDLSEQIRVAAVDSNYFDTLGLRPERGRFLLAVSSVEEPIPAVIGYGLWRRAFDADDTAIGRLIDLGERTFRIDGVAPEGFDGLELGRATEIWIPLVAEGHEGERAKRTLQLVGRLGPGVTLDDAQARLDSIGEVLAGQHPDTNRGTIAGPDDPRRFTIAQHSRLDPSLRLRVQTVGLVMSGATWLVLLSACANAGSLLLSRATARGREMAVRFALGATRARLLRLLLTESFLISFAGSAAGVLLAMWTANAIPPFFPPEHARMLDTRLDATAFAAACAIAIVAGAAFGLAPALYATRSLAAALRNDGSGISDVAGGTRLRTLLVTAQIALSVVLLVAAAIVLRNLTEALRADPGFARNLAIASVRIPGDYRNQIRGGGYLKRALERVRRLPGVEAAAWVAIPPLLRGSTRQFTIVTAITGDTEVAELEVNTASAGYFETMQIPLNAGRFFDESDTPLSPPVAIVNDALARRYFRGPAVGEHLRDADGALLEIVGVVKASRYRTLQEEPRPTVYYSLAQKYRDYVSLVGRTSGDPESMVAPLRQALVETDNGVRMLRVATFDAFLSEALALDRLTIRLVGACGLMALFLAVVGVYAVMADSVVRRTREIGVRIALGARPAAIVRLVYAQGFKLTISGLVAGLACALGGARLLRWLGAADGTVDLTTLASVPAILAFMTVLAALGPTGRALRIQPTTALRRE